MYSDNNKVIFSDYCQIDEIEFCKKKLKAKLFSTFCKLAKEGERYALVYWYTLVPLSKSANSIQLSINAVIKDKHRDAEDTIRKIVPNMHKSLFTVFSNLFKIKKNYNKYIIGEEKMIIKCPHCNHIVPCASSQEVNLLKEELKTSQAMIETLRRDNELLLEAIQQSQPIEETITPETCSCVGVCTCGKEKQPEEITTEETVFEEIVSEEIAEETKEEILVEPTTTPEEAPAPVTEEVVPTVVEEPHAEEINVEQKIEETPCAAEEIIPTAEAQEEKEEQTMETEIEQKTEEINETENNDIVEENKEVVEPEEKVEPQQDPYNIHTVVTVNI